jgi:hypothetical protein
LKSTGIVGEIWLKCGVLRQVFEQSEVVTKSMGGFSIYLLFLTATLFAAPRRPPALAIVAMIAVTILSVHRDVTVREQAIQEASASDGLIVVTKADHAVAVAASSSPQ